MSIHVIYHYKHRQRVEEWLQPLAEEGWQFELAPLGFQVGSEEWKDQVVQAISRSDLVISLLTNDDPHDESIAFRINCAQSQGKMLIPIALEDALSPPALLDACQYLMGDDMGRNTLGKILARSVKRLPKCFISYSRRDADFAARLSSDLKKSGIQAWRDEENITAGSAWDQAVQNAIKDATHALFVVSEASVNSKTVNDEVSYALDKNKILIPCILEKLELPLRVRRSQWIDFTGNYEDAFLRLEEQLKKWGGLKNGD